MIGLPFLLGPFILSLAILLGIRPIVLAARTAFFGLDASLGYTPGPFSCILEIPVPLHLPLVRDEEHRLTDHCTDECPEHVPLGVPRITLASEIGNPSIRANYQGGPHLGELVESPRSPDHAHHQEEEHLTLLQGRGPVYELADHNGREEAEGEMAEPVVIVPVPAKERFDPFA